MDIKTDELEIAEMFAGTTGFDNRKADATELERQVRIIRDNRLIATLLNAANLMLMILNRERQIIFASEKFLSMTGLEDSSRVTGLRPGNAVHCIHSNDDPSGCGGAEACRHCSALRIVQQSILSGQAATDEATILFQTQGKDNTLNILEHVVPADLYGENCYIVTMVDISDSLHRRWLEKLFFHDILNKVGALSNYMKIIRRETPDPGPLGDDLAFVEESFRTVLDDIRYQKQLMEAEAGELQPEWMTLQPAELLEQIARLYEKHDAAIGKDLRTLPAGSMPRIRSDYLLLRRVLENMVKNALEATSMGREITLGCRWEPSTALQGDDRAAALIPEAPQEAGKPESKPDGVDNGAVCFWVRNDEVMSEDIQARVFQRSFSTKGNGRGLGTYSIKLIGEQILGGKVGFRSRKGFGTEFFIRIPIRKEQGGANI